MHWTEGGLLRMIGQEQDTFPSTQVPMFRVVRVGHYLLLREHSVLGPFYTTRFLAAMLEAVRFSVAWE